MLRRRRYLRPDAACRFGTVFFGLALVVIPQSNVDENVNVLASASASYRLKKPAAKQLEVLNRSAAPAANADIADNEAAVLDACRDYVEAQLKYFGTNHNGDGVRVFALKIRSTPGKHDGLYWPIGIGEDESPVGPNIAAAAIAEQEPPDEPRPFSGYFFKVLPTQGPAATGGTRDYRVNGQLVSGFAMVAWPAQYGIGGVRTFMTNHSGDVYARDLGPSTPRVAHALKTFNPDPNWKKISPGSDENEAFK